MGAVRPFLPSMSSESKFTAAPNFISFISASIIAPCRANKYIRQLVALIRVFGPFNADVKTDGPVKLAEVRRTLALIICLYSLFIM